MGKVRAGCSIHGNFASEDGECPVCESKKEECIKRKEPQTNDFFNKREILISYLKVKTNECDWHGVSDAANDLRVLEAGNK